MRIAESYAKKAIATLFVATVFVFLYQIQTRDSRSEASVTTVTETTALPQAGARLQFSATAYCKGETTASGVGVRVDGGALPIDACARDWWTGRGIDPVIAAARGGDDYELLFAVPPRGRGALRSMRRHVAEPVLTKIGVFTKDPREMVIVRSGKEQALPEGFEHFAHR